MKLKIVILPKIVTSRPIPYWDIGSISSNIKTKCKSFALIDLETSNYYTGKYNHILDQYKMLDFLKKENANVIRSIIDDIGSLDFNIFHFYIDWWNETLPLALAISLQIKKTNKNAKILLSGPYLNSYGEDILSKFRHIDYIAVSEIEPVLIKLMKNNVTISEIPNIIYFDPKENKIIKTKEEATELNNILFPEFNSFFNKDHPDTDVLPFRLSRGCKYRCFFCACLSSEKLRYYSNIDLAIESLEKYNINHNLNSFYFEDDALNFDNEYLDSFLNKLIHKNLNIRWSAYLIAKNLPLDIIKKMKNAGCIHIRWGIESVHPSISKKIAKNISINEIENILKQTSSMGISNQVSLIVGFPYEKKQSIKLMGSFISRNKKYLKVVNLYAFKPRARTIAHNYPERFDIRILKDNAIFKKDLVPFDETKGLNWDNKKTSQQLFLKVLNKLVTDNQLLNIDPREYFKLIINK